MLSRTLDFSLIRPRLKPVIITQAICVILAGLLLDGGYGLRICIAAVLAHWIGVAFAAARNRNDFTAVDAFFVKWGFLLCLACAAIIGNMLSN